MHAPDFYLFILPTFCSCIYSHLDPQSIYYNSTSLKRFYLENFISSLCENTLVATVHFKTLQIHSSEF